MFKVCLTLMPSIIDSITILGQEYSEAAALTYEGDDNFFLADLGRRLFRINTEGVVQFTPIIDHDTKGLVPFGLAQVDDALAVINDEGTSFTGGTEMHVGDTRMLILTLDNLSDADANATLTLNVPDGMDVEEQAIGGVDEVELSRDVWLLRIRESLTEGKVRIIIESKDNVNPEYFEITGEIVQIIG
ncbi:MAG: hypothetical protein MK524_00230 [SAR202 cluster bacterium]|nr:hypothetical protein [SAR202 cluster bacterium]